MVTEQGLRSQGELEFGGTESFPTFNKLGAGSLVSSLLS